MIPLVKPQIDKNALKYIKDIFSEGWLGMGYFTRKFEDKIAGFLELKNRYVVATNTGTSALHLALMIAGVKEEDEVIVPSFNFVADHQVILIVGAKPVFCDIREDNLGVDCSSIRKLITRKTKALMVLHYAGIPCDLEGVYKLAREYNLRVIEDAAHAFGTKYNGNYIGSFGDITCFSFDPIKIVTCVDGGAVVVNKAEEKDKLLNFRVLGMNKDTIERYRSKKVWEYDVITKGFRYHLTNVNAAIGISQIQKVKQFIRNRQQYCKTYTRFFAKIKEIITPKTDYKDISPFLYYIRITNGKRNELMEYLTNRKIQTGIQWTPAHRFSYFKQYAKTELPVTEKIYKEIISLPLHSYMNMKTLNYIAQTISRFFLNYE